MDSGETLTGGLRQRLAHDLLLDLGDLGGVGDQLVEDLGGLLPQDAVGHAVRVQLHQTAGAEFIALADTGGGQRRGVGHGGMQTHALHHHGVVRTHQVQIRFGGQVVVVGVPLGLVEVGAFDPLALGGLRCPGSQLADGLCLAGTAAQVHGGVGLTVGKEVEVGITHAREHGLARQIHHLRRFAGAQHLLRGTRVYNLTVTHGQCLHHVALPGHGVYHAVFQNQIGLLHINLLCSSDIGVIIASSTIVCNMARPFLAFSTKSFVFFCEFVKRLLIMYPPFLRYVVQQIVYFIHFMVWFARK